TCHASPRCSRRPAPAPWNRLFRRFLFKFDANRCTMGAHMGRAAKPTLITLVLSAAAVLGYLAYRFTLDRAPTSAPPVVEAAPRALPDELPEFSLANLDGELQSIRDWSGRPLLINFW